MNNSEELTAELNSRAAILNSLAGICGVETWRELVGAVTEAVAIVKAIDELRADEGDSVGIMCDNPEGPPNNAVEVSAEWTGWKDQRFTGDSLFAALTAAVAAKAGAA